MISFWWITRSVIPEDKIDSCGFLFKMSITIRVISCYNKRYCEVSFIFWWGVMKKILLVALNAKYCHTSLSVRSLHAFCKKQGVDSCFVEHTINETASYILSELVKARADVYAFSCYIWNIELVKRLCRDLRQIMPDVVVLLGGPEVSFDPENPEYDFADHIICGEGEAALAAFMFTNDAYPRVINGSLTDPLSSIPFAYEDLEDIDGRLVYYESSRGCPFSCSYCLSSTISGVRFLELERVFTDLLRFEQAGVRLVKFVDRTFNANPERALKIWSFIRENCPTVSFHFEIAADLLTDEQIILLSSFEEGRIQLEIGIQSTCDNTLRAVDRNVELEKIASAVRRLRQSDNIHLHLDLIAGLPFENYERFGHSFDWVYALLAAWIFETFKGVKDTTGSGSIWISLFCCCPVPGVFQQFYFFS